DGDPVSFALTTAPSGMSINAGSGLVSWTATTAQVGTQHVVVTASDGRGGSMRQVFDLGVVGSATNQPPATTSAPPGPAVVGMPYRYQVAASDPDGDPVSFTLTTPPAGMAISAGGLVTWTPTAAQAPSQQVIVTALDGRGGGINQVFNLGVISGASDS